MCIRLYQGNFHQNGRMSTDPFSAPLLFWSCFIKKFFFYVVAPLCAFLPPPDESAPTGMNVSETYGGSTARGIITHMLVIQNIFTIFHDALFSLAACNSEHLFPKMLRLAYRGDHRTALCISEVTVASRASQSPPPNFPFSFFPLFWLKKL